MYYILMSRHAPINKLAPTVNCIDSKIKAKELVKGKIDSYLHRSSWYKILVYSSWFILSRK